LVIAWSRTSADRARQEASHAQDSLSLSLSLSLSSLALVATADAADLRVKAPAYRAPPPIALYDWTGFYIGGHVGYAWTDKNWRLASGVDLVSYTAEGVIGGVQGGYNWQTGS